MEREMDNLQENCLHHDEGGTGMYEWTEGEGVESLQSGWRNASCVALDPPCPRRVSSETKET